MNEFGVMIGFYPITRNSANRQTRVTTVSGITVEVLSLTYKLTFIGHSFINSCNNMSFIHSFIHKSFTNKIYNAHFIEWTIETLGLVKM